ncbi:hypothetical protein ACFQ1E_11775 [Sphingomonas canadensis]|uniref:Uncharacterized protein n=1 Tax=Sphingomonas canadensis TaxID=1219257 RepID=A0ABW3H6K8_9SPHN|nr:hypothetical protein [Sphingomonas canadensis]MCW3836847.1 hypothetical protein [Sphingomonas canadensis]
MSMQAEADQQKILQYLYDRLASGDSRYCTIPTIRKNTDVGGSNQYVLTLTDDLEIGGYITTRQAYQMSGGRLFQITAAGIDFIESGNRIVGVQSAVWTGRLDISEARKAEIRHKLSEIRRIIEQSRLSNSQRANALAVIEAADILVETPDPLWPEIMRLLRSPVLANLNGVASLVLAIVGIILTAANM